MSSLLKDSLESSAVVVKNGYQYFVHPLTDGIPSMDPAVLKEVTDWILENGNFDCDLIVAPESMGIPLAVPISLELSIPYTVVRKRIYGLPGEIVFEQKTGYSGNTMSINGIPEGARVVILDDVISTGGTMDSLIRALTESAKAEIVDVLVPVNKNQGKNVVLRNTGITVKTMVNVTVENGKVFCMTD